MLSVTLPSQATMKEESSGGYLPATAVHCPAESDLHCIVCHMTGSVSMCLMLIPDREQCLGREKVESSSLDIRFCDLDLCNHQLYLLLAHSPQVSVRSGEESGGEPENDRY